MEKFFEKYMLNNGVELKNRLVMAPMTTYSANEDDTVSNEELVYYFERSGGVSMVITAAAYVSKNGKGFPGQISAHDDIYIPSLRKIARAIKAQGARAILQIFHAGRQSPPQLVPDGEIVGASSITSDEKQPPRPLKTEEVQQIVKDFYEATRRAIQAGFDGVEIHGANTYLIQQFFSGFTNDRSDIYGGTVEKRLRFPLEILSAVNFAKARFSISDFIVGYRFSPEESEEAGITLDQTLYLIDALADEKLTYLHASLSRFDTKPHRYSGEEKTTVAALQKVINGRVPLISVGSIYTRDDFKRATETEADLLAIGRELLIEPYWVEKLQNEEAFETELDIDAPKALPKNLLNKLLSHPGWVPVKNQ
ncbi:MAG: NADH-dependent flavin oxidoreductase [Kurthia sp.]|nr:NADH-dependent flavin oxidoreductase [Candidatus Kurthia equi]